MTKLVTIFLALAICSSGLSQTIVPKAGLSLNAAHLNTNWAIGEGQPRLGWTIGVALDIPVSVLVSIQSEVNYIQKGTIRKIDEPDFFGRIRIKSSIAIDYIEIPALIKFSFGSAIRYFFSAGPSIAVGLGGRTRLDVTATLDQLDPGAPPYSESHSGEVVFDDTPWYYRLDPDDHNFYIQRRVDAGAQFAIGVLIQNKIMLEARYGVGFTNLIDDGVFKNRAAQFTVGIPITLKS